METLFIGKLISTICQSHNNNWTPVKGGLNLKEKMAAIIGPIAPESNPPIQPEFYAPWRYQIEDISYGATTLVTTTEDHNYVIGQTIRLLIPKNYGAQQLNYRQGYVISIPQANQVEVDIVSLNFNAFIPNPYTATITNILQSFPCAVVANNNFRIGQHVTINNVSGMTELNGNTYEIFAAFTNSFFLNVDAQNFNAYVSGGTATIIPNDTDVPQIIPIGDINQGIVNSSGRKNNGTFIPGSFINVSP